MDIPYVAFVVSAFITLVLAYTTIVVVALCKADQRDIPKIMRDARKSFTSFARTAPGERARRYDHEKLDERRSCRQLDDMEDER